MGTRGPFPGGKALPGHDTDHLPHLVQRSRMSRSYTSAPLVASMAVAGQLYFYLYNNPYVIDIGQSSVKYTAVCQNLSFVASCPF
jgi:hypothetical protein